MGTGIVRKTGCYNYSLKWNRYPPPAGVRRPPPGAPVEARERSPLRGDPYEDRYRDPYRDPVLPPPR